MYVTLPFFVFLTPRWLTYHCTKSADHEGMLGLKKSQAGKDLVAPKKKSKPKKAKEEFEEWHGIETES